MLGKFQSRAATVSKILVANGCRRISPARFYVSTVVKMVLAHLLVAYEFKLESPTAKPVYSFGKARLPSPFMTLLVRKRILPDGKRE